MAGGRRRIAWGLVAAIVIYVALRALMLLTNFEGLVLPNFEIYPMGTMAQLAVRGVSFPARFYYDNAAGQLVLGQLTIPFYALFGPNYMVLKCVPALLGLATLVLLWVLLDRHFSRLAANIGALLFALGPPALARYSVVCSGNHFENLFFTTLFLVLFYRHHFDGQRGIERTQRSLFFAAFAGGLAIFVFFGALILVGICAAMHLGLRGWKRTLRDVPSALVGFALGIAPLIVINALTSARGLGFLGAKFAQGAGAPREGSVLARIGDFVGPSLLQSGQYEPVLGISRTQWGVVFVLAFVVVYIASLPSVARSVADLVRGALGGGALGADGPARSSNQPAGISNQTGTTHSSGPASSVAAQDNVALERAKLVPFVLYVPLAALAYGISNLKLGMFSGSMEVGGYRYLLPTLLISLLLGSVWCARWFQRGGRARIGATVLGAALILPCATSLAIPDWTFREVGNGWRYEGYNYAQMSRGLLSARNAVSQAEIIARTSTWPPDVRDRVVRGLGFNLCLLEIGRAGFARRDAWVVEIERVLEGYPPEWRLLMANGAGAALHFQHAAAEVPAMLRRVRPSSGELFDEVVAGAAAENVSLFVGEQSVATFREDVEMLALDLPDKPAFERGCGHYFGRLLRRGIPHEKALVEAFRANFTSPAFEEGLKRGLDGLER